MPTPLDAMTADHRRTLAAVGRTLEFADPIAFQLSGFRSPLLKHAVPGELFPLHGVLVRDWDRDCGRQWPGLYFGIRVYRIDGILFARAVADCHENGISSSSDFFVVDRRDYAALFRKAMACRERERAPGPPPVLADETFAALRRNTVDFLEPAHLARIQELGGRPKRGLLLTGPPGNGKTSACRWIWEQCRAKGIDYRIVSPDDYRAARQSDDPAEAIKNLFTFTHTGVAFFDDLDIALRDRDQSGSSDDQSVFLAALDGIEVNRGTVAVFTTNLKADKIDKAFLRPGRIDAILPFPKPTQDLRRKAIHRWNPAMLAALPMDAILADTDSLSFAELDELKNLLIAGYLEHGRWDWAWAWEQFRGFRQEMSERNRVTGFAPVQKTDRESSYVTQAVMSEPQRDLN